MKKILVIEDDITLRSEISTILNFEGFNVLEAENGLAGLNFAVSLLPDIILCDIMMPEMDGIQVLREIRATESTRLIPFVLLTALAERSNLRQGMEMGADDYITKPFTRDELLNAVSIHLDKAAHIEQHHEKELNSLREAIISKIPHELNTPLHGILGFSQILNEEAGKMDAFEIRKIAEYITISGNRLLNLVKRYNHFINLLASQDQLQLIKPSSTPPEFLMSSIMANLATDYSRPDDIDFNFENGDILMSDEHFESVFRELIDNSFKFSESGTKIHVKSINNNDNYIIIIEDSGRGISAENIKRIGAFQQFEREIYEQQGSGLGLAISKLIIEQNGGKLHIKSEIGIGTTITISLPMPSEKK